MHTYIILPQVTLCGGEGYPAGLTPLMMAARNRSIEVVEILLDKADVSLVSPDGFSALSCALESEDLDITEKIIQKIFYLTNPFAGLEETFRMLAMKKTRMTETVKRFVKQSSGGMCLD